MFMIPRERRTRRADLVPFRSLDRMFDEAFNTFPAFAASRSLSPATDISETDDAVTLTIELPGVKPEDVKLSLENEELTIRAEKKHEAQDTDARSHRVERSYGILERRFTLPSVIDTEKIDARQADGILTVVLPKSERARSREIEVK